MTNPNQIQELVSYVIMMKGLKVGSNRTDYPPSLWSHLNPSQVVDAAVESGQLQKISYDLPEGVSGFLLLPQGAQITV